MRLRGLVAIGLAVFVAAGCGSGTPTGATRPSSSTTTPTLSRLAQAVDKCSATSGVRVADAGTTVLIDGIGKGEPGQDQRLNDTDCILETLGATAAVRSHIGDTRALDGMQTDTWDGITARWTYHPDHGLDMTLVDSK